MSTSRSINNNLREDPSGPPKTKLIRIPPYHYLHVLDRNTNVTRLVVGPQTFVCKEHERLVFGPEKMVIVPPRHYCIITNPVVRSKPDALNEEEEEQKLISKKDAPKKVEKKAEQLATPQEEHQDRIRNIIEREQATRGDVLYDAQGQAILLHGEKEIRFSYDEPFPLYPGEILEGPIRPLQIVQANTAILLRANIDFQDKFGAQGPVQRKAGEQWLWYGPSTYYPQTSVDILSTVNSTIIKPNQALKLKAQRECLDYNNVKRKPGEQWLVRREGAYLPNACESVIGLVDAIVLTEKIALHLRALQTFTDELGKERKVGEEWLVTHKDKETHIPDVYEQIVAQVQLMSLSNREYCCIRDPVDENNVPQLGQRKLLVGEANFFLQPGETLEYRNPVYVLGEEEALAVNCLKSFTEEFTYKGKQYKIPRIAGQRYDVFGPREYVPPLQVQVLTKKTALVQLESFGLYMVYVARHYLIMADYGKLEYWDERYSRDLDPFDWLQRFSGLKTILTKQIKLGAHVLHVGCGTSRLPEEMATAGYKSITSIDWSPVVISHMQEKYKDHAALAFTKMNALSLEYSDNSFEAVIAKGTVDALLCGENSTANIDQVLNEVNRVLKPGGVFVVISCAGPDSRNPHFERSKFPKWKTEVLRVDKPQVLSVRTEPGDDVHFVYLLYKE